MWRPDRVAVPGRATHDDIDALNRVFSDAFTDRYRRDGLVGVRVPHLDPRIWRFAIDDAGEGAMAWRDQAGEVVAFNMVHRSGTEGWMGPLAVRPDRQGGGLGRAVVSAGVRWLQGQGAVTIGLETMPRTVDNIGFYSRLGFVPGHLTITVARDLGRRGGAAGDQLQPGPGAAAGIAECAALSRALGRGADFTREIALTLDLELGGVSLVRDDGGALAGFALWHTAPLALGRSEDELRVLKLVARDEATFARVMEAVEGAAQRTRARRVAVRCQTAFGGAYRALVAAGYRVHWTDLRMVVHGHPEPAPPVGAVVFSNWEI